MFYHNRKTVVYKVIWSVIYSFLDNLFILIIWVYYNESYPITTTSLEN